MNCEAKVDKGDSCKLKSQGLTLKIFVCWTSDPPMFTHVQVFTERFRGSGRLQATAVNPAEETSYYVTGNPKVGHHIDMDEDGLVTLLRKQTFSLFITLDL